MRPMIRSTTASCASFALAVGLSVGLASPALAATRIELADASGQPAGYAIVQHRAGRVDYYTLWGRRRGWGRVNPLSEAYRVDFFSADGLPTGYALVDLATRRAEFFDHRSHPLGSGTLDPRGHVTPVDLAGRRRGEMALPIQPVRPAADVPRQ